MSTPRRTAPPHRPTAQPRAQVELAERLALWLRRQDLKPGDHVPERLVTEAFHVSRTPVRAALTLLVQRGLLERRDRRGFFVAGDLQATADAPEQTGLHAAILRDRFSKRLESEVTAARLMKRYRVSRPEAMRALTRLQQEGIVERALGQRWVFLPALDSLRSQEESHRFRLVLEPAAFEQPGFALDRARARELRLALNEMILQGPAALDMKRVLDTDIAFHEAMGEASQNRFLADAIRRQSRLRRLATSSMQVPPPRLVESCREHLAILDAVEAGDLARAATLMREHLAASLRARPGFVNRGAPPMLGGLRRAV
ncbi:MAG: GntR family transcriptional regulator [Rhodospirillaceae bacterium]|nr:GntR family transcriptional regulator [Rhodospirillaceae bacterium]